MFEKRDDQLVAKALKGDKKSWLQLISRYEKPVYHYGVRMTGNHSDAADLMQEIFLSVFRSLQNYRGEGSFKGWLFKIAHYRCMEFYRRKRPEQSDDEIPDVACKALTPDEQMLQDQNSASLTQAMQSLPISQRAVVELKFFGQFTFEEIAEQLGVSSNTVKSRLYAALDKLRNALESVHA